MRGNLVSETDALGHVTEYTYDDLGRRTGVTDAAGETTSVCYNEIGNVDRICHPNGSSTVYTYEREADSEVCFIRTDQVKNTVMTQREI